VLTSTATIEVERRWHRWIERRTARWDSGHIVNSRALAEHVERAFAVPRERIHVVPMALERFPTRVDRAAARRQFEIGDDEFAVLWAGRFDPVKRMDLILDVARGLASGPFRFLLAGDGPIRAEIEASLAARPAPAALLGWMDDLSPVLSAADAFLFPSLTEGTPNAVLQAMAAGVPVVGSDIPALRELAGDEGRIRLVSGSSSRVYADELRRLRDDASAREQLATQSQAWARENLDFSKLVAATIAVYERVLAASKPAQATSTRES
jgi:glycosyltransferase involved in cell wall biosynthesis